MEKITLVLGASTKPERFSNKAIKRLQKLNYPVIALGLREDYIGELRILKGMPQDLGPVHTIALYLGAGNQKQYYDYIISLKPRRIIFNPGTINFELTALAQKNGIETINDCLLDMLNLGSY
ncbi:MAG: CoA-binding protein [Bacteroidetes bacterium GWE2_41_25]|nr:MAG: CoA-binding protein [Bacteroidetes bacterium GWA2_40_15]OFX89746.1 MAG: CoA-binding protein [Bacteroidetes bacterium GWC2_40_22]OFY00626.1 MAG: CoA-binding protein [Bacteroidetes bacterium GWE2_41_25]OFY57919.1 MAG: CoA-binding protein [Bacteroidetes bacterium GWF2_41_9]HAM09099.1 CoA-binding protein [Bacteroidales bacterium]